MSVNSHSCKLTLHWLTDPYSFHFCYSHLPLKSKYIKCRKVHNIQNRVLKLWPEVATNTTKYKYYKYLKDSKITEANTVFTHKITLLLFNKDLIMDPLIKIVRSKRISAIMALSAFKLYWCQPTKKLVYQRASTSNSSISSLCELPYISIRETSQLHNHCLNLIFNNVLYG